MKSLYILMTVLSLATLTLKSMNEATKSPSTPRHSAAQTQQTTSHLSDLLQGPPDTITPTNITAFLEQGANPNHHIIFEARRTTLAQHSLKIGKFTISMLMYGAEIDFTDVSWITLQSKHPLLRAMLDSNTDELANTIFNQTIHIVLSSKIEFTDPTFIELIDATDITSIEALLRNYQEIVSKITTSSAHDDKNRLGDIIDSIAKIITKKLYLIVIAQPSLHKLLSFFEAHGADLIDARRHFETIKQNLGETAANYTSRSLDNVPAYGGPSFFIDRDQLKEYLKAGNRASLSRRASRNSPQALALITHTPAPSNAANEADPQPPPRTWRRTIRDGGGACCSFLCSLATKGLGGLLVMYLLSQLVDRATEL